MRYFQVDYILSDAHYVMNMSKVYDPIGTKIHNSIVGRQHPIGNMAISTEEGYLPIHHRTNPFSTQKGNNINSRHASIIKREYINKINSTATC